MEPTIYKPGVYKSPGIYNGAGGIYNGRGVYNDGGVFFENIGGLIYPCIKIENIVYMCENLYYKDENIEANSSSYTASGLKCYDLYKDPLNGYNGNKYNYYYNFNALEYIKTLDFGEWRVARKNDYLEILNNYSYKDIKSVEYWSTPGENTSKLNFFPGGFIDFDFNSFVQVGTVSLIWIYEEYNSIKQQNFIVRDNEMLFGYSTKNLICLPIRLCKDA